MSRRVNLIQGVLALIAIALVTTLFLGGWHAPLPFNLIPGLDSGWWGLLWFTLKVLFFLFILMFICNSINTLSRSRHRFS